jgi:FkbM family methyltransferase
MPTPKLLTGPFNHLRECRHGVMLYNVHDVYIGRAFELYGEWSEAEIEVFRQIVRPGDTVVDAGAHIGSHALFLAKAVGPRGRVYAFEPQRVLFQTLCANMALNGMPNAFCRHAALGEKPGTVSVPAIDYAVPANFGGLSLEGQASGEAVELATLDGMDLPTCRLIKIDVEGMESQVLRGGRNLIARDKPILYVENDKPERAQELTGLIDALGYEMYRHLAPLYNPANFFGNPENIFGKIVSANLLCVHPSLGLNITGFQRTGPGDYL